MEPRSEKARILVAEDSRADTELFMRVLRPFMKGKKWTVDCVHDGDAAMDLIRKGSYDILFLDMNMPGPTGIEILRYIKENRREEKVVILSGYPDVNDHFCKTLGAHEYIAKPIESKALAAILEKYIPENERRVTQK